MMTDPTTVNALVDAAVEAMETVESNADEVLSATMTLALRTMKACLQMGANPKKMQKAVEVLLLACADSEKMN